MGDSAAVIHLKNLTVKMFNSTRSSITTGFIIGSRSNPPLTIIMTCAHTAPNVEDTVLVSFYGHEDTFHASRTLIHLPTSEIMLTTVNHQHSGAVLRFANVLEQPSVYQGPTPIMRPPVRVHCVGHNLHFNWVFHSGYIVTELMTNSISRELDNNLVLFGQYANTSKGCSGTAMVNDNLEILGMQISGNGRELNLLRSDPVPQNLGQMGEQQYAQAGLVYVHNTPLFHLNNAYIPQTSVSFSTSVHYINRKIRDHIGDVSNLPLNQVVANYVFQRV